MGKLSLLLIVSLIISACGNYSHVRNNPEQDINISQQIQTLDFATIKKEILQPHCINCHTGQHEAYEQYAIVKASGIAMLSRMQHPNPSLRMPRGAPALSQEKIALFAAWIEEGAPEFSKADNNKDPKPQPTEFISFEQIKTRVLKPYNCTSCHSQFNDFHSVKIALGSIASLVTADKMPFPARKGELASPVKPQDKDLLIQWIGEGAHEFSSGHSSPSTEKLEPTYLSVRNKIIGPKCVLCHNSFGNRGAGLNLNSFGEIQKAMMLNPSLIQTDSPEDSHIIGAIKGRVDDDEFFFDAMPFNNSADDVTLEVPPVTEEELEIIKKWIEKGLPFNPDE